MYSPEDIPIPNQQRHHIRVILRKRPRLADTAATPYVRKATTANPSSMFQAQVQATWSHMPMSLADLEATARETGAAFGSFMNAMFGGRYVTTESPELFEPGGSVSQTWTIRTDANLKSFFTRDTPENTALSNELGKR